MQLVQFKTHPIQSLLLVYWMQFVSGAIKLSNALDSSGVDFLLLEIVQTIPSEFNIYYMGSVNNISLFLSLLNLLL